MPEGVLFLMTNKDRPGIVGYVGTLMGKHNVNIAAMSSEPRHRGRPCLDGVEPGQRARPRQRWRNFRNDPDISNVHVVKL